MKNKKVLIIGGITAILIAVGGFIFWQRKKAAEENALDELAARYDSETGGAESSLDTKKSQLGDLGEGTKMTQVSTAAAPVATAAAPVETSLPANTVKMLRTVEDSTKKQVIARVSPKGVFKTGDYAIVKGNIYDGKFKVWYVYKTHATEDAIYLDTPYKGDDVGIITKA